MMKTLIICLLSVYCSFATACPDLSGVFTDTSNGNEITISQTGCEKVVIGSNLEFLADGVRYVTFENNQMIQYRQSQFMGDNFVYTMGMERKDITAKFIADGTLNLDSVGNLTWTNVYSSENGPAGSSTKLWIKR